jgi:hypothetical protein
MEVIALPRGCGKTHSLIRRCHHLGGILVCSHRIFADYAKSEAKKMGITIETSSFRDLITGKLRGHKKPLLIDNAEFFFQLFGSKIAAISVTPELNLNP